MSNYKKVQFISWEVYSGPIVAARDAQGQPTAGVYVGWRRSPSDARTDVMLQRLDIEARVAFTADAIARAYADSDKDASTLKVFMGPEFLYRGAGGAYLHDLINGWSGDAPAEFGLPAPFSKPWPGLFGSLQALAAKPEYEDWLFVFGSAISASFPSARSVSGKYLLDPSKPGEIYNTALVQRGGPSHRGDNYASRKHYISGIDFIHWNGAVNQHKPGTVLPLDAGALIPADVLGVTEGGAVFRIAGINDGAGKAIDFGLEICLDHLCSGGNGANAFGRIRTAGEYVKIQLVPSGGMHLVDASIRLQPGAGPTPFAYAFNCDGLRRGSQVWNGANGAVVQPANKLLEAGAGNVGQGTVGSTVRAVAPTAAIGGVQIAASDLWNDGNAVQGAGHVRILKALAL
ncbi:hypothetical protein [Massilia sp. CF038]|uniref:hypothetical protein n=1 Tax=Massilia sp. CF038 TaxID=1881045 RepID=UPI00091D0015|nr:hypothetical protein [Massilia sp. CF038]SHG48473.1 hypothetical protein SAMN05428948_0679 [Massilia sp. CF038]